MLANHYCCVPQCHSWAKKDVEKELSFHLFPKENSNKVYVVTEIGKELVDRRKAWICKLCIGKPVTKFMKVCSLHFTAEDYFNKGQKVGSRGRVLKKTAVPSQNLPMFTQYSKKPSPMSSSSERYQGTQQLAETSVKVYPIDGPCTALFKTTCAVSQLDYIKKYMPGRKSCCVAMCKSNSTKIKENGENILFFNFPKNAEICKEWIRRCYRKDTFSPNNKHICSKHFKTEDFEDEFKANLLGIQPKKLKKAAIPSLFLLPLTQTQEAAATSMKHLERAEKKTRQNLVETLLRQKKEGKIAEMQKIEVEEEIEAMVDIISPGEYVHQQLNTLTQENNALKWELEENTKIIGLLKNKSDQLELKLQESNICCDIRFEQNAKQVLKHFLTPKQAEIDLKKKSRARWNQKELARAFILWYLGKKSYVYLRRYFQIAS